MINRPMIKSFFITIIFLFSVQAQASLRELIKSTFSNNLTLENSRVKVLTNEQNLTILNSNLDFRLNFETSFVDSNFERDPFSLVAANTAWSNELSLSKSFIWGGELAFVNQYRQLDPKSSFSKSYLFQQKLIYTQDLGQNFLGRSLQKDIEALEIENEVGLLELTLEQKEQLLTLAILYVEGSTLNEQILLEKASIKRLEKRLKYVKNQVRDGIREKVDEYRAKENLLARQSALRDVEHRLWELREQIGQIVLINVTQLDFKKNSIQIDWTKPWIGWHLKENVDRQLLIKRLEAIGQKTKSLKQKNSADIKLVTSYGTNNWEVESSKAISGGYLTQDNDEKTIALQVSLPLGNNASEAELIKVSAQKQMLEKYVKNWDEVLINTATTLGERHKLLAQNLDNASQRVQLAQKALDSYTLLYAKGRVDLDQLISAEEQLIGDQRLILNSRKALANLTLEAQALAGRLPDFLLKTIDL